jgi:hypothetical protein
MNNLDKIRMLAQEDADRLGGPLAILSLVHHSKLYVIREWKDSFADGSRYAAVSGFVERVEPKAAT